MVIARKVKKDNSENFISKGGDVLPNIEKGKKETKNVLLSIPLNMIETIERLLKKRVGIKRHGWILEAIEAQIKKHSKE